MTVDVYQVGVAPTSQDGGFLHPDTEEPLIKAGDDLVFVNYVVTNNGAPIDLGMELVHVGAAYDDWEWLQEMWGIEDDALMEDMGIQWTAPDLAKIVDRPVFVLGTAESYSFGTNFKYQQDSPMTLTVRHRHHRIGPGRHQLPEYAAAAARAAAGRAATISSTTASSWAAETNHASNAEGGGAIPAATREWKNGAYRQCSLRRTPA